jgi:hypothetical protein
VDVSTLCASLRGGQSRISANGCVDVCEADSFCANSPSGCCLRSGGLKGCNATRRVSVIKPAENGAAVVVKGVSGLGVALPGLLMVGMAPLVLQCW